MVDPGVQPSHFGHSITFQSCTNSPKLSANFWPLHKMFHLVFLIFLRVDISEETVIFHHSWPKGITSTVCLVYIVQYSVKYSVQCTLYSTLHTTVFSVYSTAVSAQWAVYIVQYTTHYCVQCALFTVYTVYTVQHCLYSVQCTLYRTGFTMWSYVLCSSRCTVHIKLIKLFHPVCTVQSDMLNVRVFVVWPLKSVNFQKDHKMTKKCNQFKLCEYNIQ